MQKDKLRNFEQMKAENKIISLSAYTAFQSCLPQIPLNRKCYKTLR